MNIILKAAAALLAVTLAASCVFEKEEPSQTQQKYKYVLVQLGVNTDKMVATKAQGDAVNAEDNAGDSLETAIKDLKVYAYTLDASNNKVLRGYLSTQNVNAAATATQPLLMDIKVPFNEYGGKQQVYFMAVANAGGMTGANDIIINSIGRDPQTGALVLPESFGFDDFASIRYSVADQTFANGMPMYCQTSAAVEVNLGATGTTSTAPGHNGHTHLPVQVTLDMTRSLSKIEVYAAESASATTDKDSTATTSVTITGVSLANVPESGNLFTAPADNATLTYTDFNGEGVQGTGYSSSFLKDEADTVTVNKKVSETATADIQNPDNYTLVSNAYYLAENNQGSTRKENGKDIDVYEYGSDAYSVVGENGVTVAATVLKIDYKVGGTEKTGYVKMPQIKRNTWYKVLARIKANGQMTLTLKVLPWNDTEEQVIDFADNVSLQGAITWTGGSYNETTSTVTLGSSKGSSSTCTFTMDAPKGGYWYVTLAKGDISNFTLKSESETTGKTTLSGAIVPGQQIKFIVETLEGNYLAGTKTADLHITARTADGRTLVVRHGSGKDAFYKIVQSQN